MIGDLDKSFYVKILEFGDEKKEEGFFVSEFVLFIKEETNFLDDVVLDDNIMQGDFRSTIYINSDPNIPDLVRHKADILNTILEEIFPHQFRLRDSSDDAGTVKRMMSFDGQMKLLEYQELQDSRKSAEEANKNAKEAKKYSSIAIGISIFSILVAAILSIWQIEIEYENREIPTEIENTELELMYSEMRQLEDLSKNQLEELEKIRCSLSTEESLFSRVGCLGL